MATGVRPVHAALVLGAALLLLIGALVLPGRCRVNELGHHRARITGDLSLGAAPRAPQERRFAAACGPAVVPGEGSAILRPPYLQKVTASAAAVLFTGAALARPAVAAWPAGAPQEARVVSAEPEPDAPLPRGRQLQASLDRLQPAATYCYEVRDGDRVLAGPFGFTTAPPPGDPRPVRIAAFGDMGYRTSDQEAVLAQLAQTEFDLALLTGDIAYPDGKLVEYERNFFQVYAPLLRSAPFFPASGNHDFRTAGGAPFRQVFALPENGGVEGLERWYSIDWGPVHVVVLDTEAVGPAQEKWLEADLRANRLAWVIAVMHHPPYASAPEDRQMPGRWMHPIFARHRVPLVLAGHEHHYERRRPLDGVTYVITGGGGRGTRPVHPDAGAALAVQVAHHLLLEVTGRELRMWAIDATGRTFDTMVLSR